MEAEVKQHPKLGRGHALVTLTGGGLPSANVRYAIHRAGSRDTVLGAQGWQAAEAWLVPLEFEGGGEKLLLTLGPDVVNHMDNANYLISVTGDQVSEPLLTGLAWLDIAPADAAPAVRRGGVAVLEDRNVAPPVSQSPANVSVTVVLQQPQAPEPRRSDPPPAPVPPPPPPPPKPWLRRVAMAVIVLLLLGGVAWRFLLPPKPQEVELTIKPADPPPAPKEETSAAPTPLPPLPDPSKQQAEEKKEPAPKPVEEAKADPAPKPVEAKTEPAPKPPEPAPPAPAPRPQPASLPPIEQARAALSQTGMPADEWAQLADKLRGLPDGADAAFLLYRNAGQRGHAKSAMLTGGYFDPTDSDPKGTIMVDAVQAYSWYKRAADANVGDAASRLSRLKVWVDREAAAGNANAKRALEWWK